MKKMKSIPVYLFVVVVNFSLLLFGCSEDNPVIQPPESPYEYDSARFNWKVDSLFGDGYFKNLWAKDTNEFFIANLYSNTLAHVKNGIKTFVQYPSYDRLGGVFGDENNNGYRVGAILIDTIYQPLLQKWDGNNFAKMNNPQNLDRNFFYWTAFIKNSTEMWFGLTDGTVLNFDGINFVHYPLTNPDLVFTKFFYDESNTLNFLAYDPHYNLNYAEILVYKLRDNKWMETYSDSLGNKIMGPIKYDIVGNVIAPLGLHEIYELVENTPIPRLNIPVYVFHLGLAGTSYEDILIAGFERFPGCNGSFFHWNGKKWSLELCNYSTSFRVEILTLNENCYYAITYDQVWNETYVIRGTKK